MILLEIDRGKGIFRDPNGKKIGEYGGKVNLKEFNLWIPKKK